MTAPLRFMLDTNIASFIVRGANEALKAKLRAHPGWAAVRAVREGRVLVVDTTLVGRPGVRMGEAARHIRRLLYPDGAR